MKFFYIKFGKNFGKIDKYFGESGINRAPLFSAIFLRTARKMKQRHSPQIGFFRFAQKPFSCALLGKWIRRLSPRIGMSHFVRNPTPTYKKQQKNSIRNFFGFLCPGWDLVTQSGSQTQRHRDRRRATPPGQILPCNFSPPFGRKNFGQNKFPSFQVPPRPTKHNKTKAVALVLVFCARGGTWTHTTGVTRF